MATSAVSRDRCGQGSVGPEPVPRSAAACGGCRSNSRHSGRPASCWKPAAATSGSWWRAWLRPASRQSAPDFARALGRLAKTDRLAQVLARFRLWSRTCPLRGRPAAAPPRPQPSGSGLRPRGRCADGGPGPGGAPAGRAGGGGADAAGAATWLQSIPGIGTLLATCKGPAPPADRRPGRGGALQPRQPGAGGAAAGAAAPRCAVRSRPR